MIARTRAARAGPDWRAAGPILIASFLLGRLIVAVAAVLAEIGNPLDPGMATTPQGLRVLWTSEPLLRSFTSWDSVYYLGIATEGYHAAPVNAAFPDWVFFPVLPVLIRIVSWLGVDPGMSGVLISNAAFAASVPMLYALGVRVLEDEPRALRAAALLGIVAGGTAFSMAYSDAVFLLVTLAAFLAAERGGDVRSVGVAYALATLARPPGIAIGLPLAMLLVGRAGWSARLGWLLLGPLALAGFSGYLWVLTGDPLAWIRGQALWRPGEPSLGDSLAASANPPPFSPVLIGTILIAVLVVGVVALLLARRAGIPWPYFVLGMITVIVIAASGLLISTDRFIAAAWPSLWVLATPRNRILRFGWPLVSGIALLVLSYASFYPALPP